MDKEEINLVGTLDLLSIFTECSLNLNDASNILLGVECGFSGRFRPLIKKHTVADELYRDTLAYKAGQYTKGAEYNDEEFNKRIASVARCFFESAMIEKIIEKPGSEIEIATARKLVSDIIESTFKTYLGPPPKKTKPIKGKFTNEALNRSDSVNAKG